MKFLTFCLGNYIADQFIAEIGGLNTQYKQVYIAQYEIVKLDIFSIGGNVRYRSIWIMDVILNHKTLLYHTLRKKCPNTEFFLVRIFP